MTFLLGAMRCPRTGRKLREVGGRLVAEGGRFSYRVEDGIPVLLPEEAVDLEP